MDIQSAVLNELFVLFPVIIPGWITPVKPPGIAHGGIPQSLYDGQSKGLECLIDPWIELQRQSWTLAVDDRVELFINDDPTPVAGATVKPGEEALRQRLYIPHGYLRQGVNRLYYKVFRVGGNTSEESRDLLVLYHLRTPDNLDLVIPPDVIKDGVSADRAAQGVEFGFSYNNRRPYDRIQLLMGDTQVTFDVPDGTAAITHTLFTDTFRAAGNNPSAVSQFLVIDQLGNRSKSPEKRLDIHLESETFDSPILRERLNDPGDDQTEIDLEKLAGDPLLIIVLTSDVRMLLGDLISVTYICKVTGQPDVVVTPPAGTVEADEFGQRKPCVFEVPNERVIADGSVTVTYKVHRANGDAVGSSRVARAQVVGEALPAATLAFTNGPYEVFAGEAFDVGLLLTRDGIPQANGVITLRLASGFQFPGGGVGARDFITDAKGVVTVTGIIASGTEGGHELVAKSKGASDAVARVEVLAEGPVGYIDLGSRQYNIVMASDGTVYVELDKQIAMIDSRTNRTIDFIEKEGIEYFLEMVITPNGEKIYASAYNKGLIVISTLSRKIIKRFTAFTGHYLAISKDGSRVASFSQSESIKIINTSTDTIIKDLLPTQTPHAYISINHEGTQLYYAARHTNHTLAAASSETGLVITSKTYPIQTLGNPTILSTDGAHLYTILVEYRTTPQGEVFSARIEKLAINSLQLMRTFNLTHTPKDQGELTLTVASPDRLIITSRATTKATLINLNSGKEENLEIGYTHSRKMAYTPDYKRLFACNHFGNLLKVFALDK
ncbi:YncE family protein [Pseudomonas fluorescens]|uniref:YncE family protein n=1 Tax=Pseudomonas fluorescens TaxID=294 RepID=UPI00160B0C08|nr:WD40 repeat domain-containing protein [Pseudomonas fluorescens]